MTWYPSKAIIVVALIAAMVTLCFFATRSAPGALAVITPVIVGLLALAQGFMKPMAESTAAMAKTVAIVKAASNPPPAPAAEDTK